MLHKSKVVAAKGIRMIGSTMHFTFQTAADLVLAGEVEVLKQLDVYDLSSEQLKQARIERTKLTQYKVKQTSKSFLKRKKSSSEPINQTTLFV